MDEKFQSILSVALIPQIVALIAVREKMGEDEAMEAFYRSETYELLSREETKLWHYSPLTLCRIWEQERQTGMLVFPEE